MKLFGQSNENQLDKLKILKLVQLKKKGRSERQLRHVLDQWQITGITQSRYIAKVKEQILK